MRDSAHSQPCRNYVLPVHRDRSRCRYKRELIRLTIADLEVMRGASLRTGRDLDRNDQVAPTEDVVSLRRVAGQAMELGERNRSLSIRAAYDDLGIERGECHRHIGSIGSDAGVR